MAELFGCMECTDWDVFFSPGNNLYQTVTDFGLQCVL